MRVTQVINHAGLERGGAERLARSLHEDLCAAGCDARLIALENCDLNGLPGATSLGFDSPRDPRVLMALMRRLRIDQRPDDVIHAHLFPSTLYVSVLKKVGLLRAPCSMTEHSTWNRRRAHLVLRSLDRFIYAGFSKVVSISDQTAEALLQSYPGLPSRCVTIRNGAHLRFADPVPRSARQEAPCLLSVARLEPVKNLSAALQALAQLQERPWRYVIAGGGSEEGRLRQMTQSLGLADRVQFLGMVEDVGPLLREADLFLMPSRWEGFGLAAVEAMNAGLPVIASDVPGLREVVRSAGNPVVPVDDVPRLAREIAALLDDPVRRAHLGAAGFTEAKRYDKFHMTRHYISMWSELTGEAPA